MPLQATSGAASYDAFGGGVPVVPNYIEEVFSTYLYAGNSSTQTITNGIDLAGKGGLVWTKARADRYHNLEDTVRGAGNSLWANVNSANYYYSDAITAFGSTGYTLGADNTGNQVNSSPANYVSWTFRKQPKFFDIVTFTGNSTANRNIAHSLGSVPGCVIVRDLLGGNWNVYHRSVGITKALALDVSDPAGTSPNYWDAIPTSTVFTVGTDSQVNFSGHDYVAYIFAHDAGGFGLLGTDNVISCGSYTGNGSATGPVVTLGYEPQWLIIKNSSNSGSWQIIDNMRGMPVGSADATLQSDTSATETFVEYVSPTATGFQVTSTSSQVNTSTNVYIYIAIRRGPMKVPTSGTSVFDPVTYTGTGANSRQISSSITPDSVLPINRGATESKFWYDRLRDNGVYLQTNSTAADQNDGAVYGAQFNVIQTGYQQGTSDGSVFNISANTYVNYLIKRAPSVFDIVCYTGTGSNTTFTHNLGVAPELMIIKSRSLGSSNWPVYATAVGATKVSYLDGTSAFSTSSTLWNDTATTSSVFTVGTSTQVNQSGDTYIAYLFSTCAGVSKVGSYTGTATTLQIDCGFTGGARFVLIKRTDSTGAWYVWDTARGIVSGNDPYLLLNSTAAEVTNTDYIDTYSAGFEISSTAPAAINASGGTYIFLAIA